MKSIFTGSCTAMVTPFNEAGVNYPVLKQMIEFQIANGTDALLFAGTTGEPSTMSEQEKQELITFAVKEVNGRVPVIAGVGCNETSAVIERSRFAKHAGADALLVVTPYYNKATQKGLIAHFTAIADATDLPIIAYNVPGRTGLNLLPSTFAKIAEHPNIAAIKEASGNISQICDLMVAAKGKADVYSGDDGLNFPMLALGAKGTISVVSNVAPKYVHDMTAQYFAGNIECAREMHERMLPICKALFCEVNPIPVKTALRMIGFDTGLLRLPLTEMEEGNYAYLKKEMEAFGLC